MQDVVLNAQVDWTLVERLILLLVLGTRCNVNCGSSLGTYFNSEKSKIPGGYLFLYPKRGKRGSVSTTTTVLDESKSQ